MKKELVLEDEEKITPGGWPWSFGTDSVRYNLQVLDKSEQDSIMREIAKGNKTYSEFLDEAVELKKPSFLELILFQWKIPSKIKNKELVLKIVKELNSLYLENDGYEISPYSAETRNRKELVTEDELNGLLNLNSSESRFVYNHINTKITEADIFFKEAFKLNEIFNQSKFYKDKK